MTTSYTAPSYSNLHEHIGHELAVVPEPCRLVTDTVLVLESLSTPWECEGLAHFEVRFTGPAGQELLPDFYRLRGGAAVFSLYLEPIARDLRFVHYVVMHSESTTAVPTAAGTPLAG